MADEIRFLGDLQRLEVKPGDKFVLTLDCQLSMEQQARLGDYWMTLMGPDCPLIVIEPGMKLGVLGKSET